MIYLKVKDQTAVGDILNEIEIAIDKERITLKELITARVTAEVEAYNKKKGPLFNGLVQPKDAESTLNGYKLKRQKEIDPEKQVYVALESFTKNGFFVLIDNQQVADLEQEVLVSPETEVGFVKLTALVGG